MPFTILFAGEKSKPKDLQCQNLHFCFIHSKSVPAPSLLLLEYSLTRPEEGRSGVRKLSHVPLPDGQCHGTTVMGGKKKKKSAAGRPQSITVTSPLVTACLFWHSVRRSGPLFTGKKYSIHNDKPNCTLLKTYFPIRSAPIWQPRGMYTAGIGNAPEM